MEEEHEMSSLRARRKKPSVGISCCFSGTTKHRRRASFEFDSASSSSPSPIPHHASPRLISPSAWIKSKTNDLPEIKGKCRNFISRRARHRRHASADFGYDPLSYALNFDDDTASSSEEFQAMNNFTARLPVSPPRRTTKTTTPFDHHLPRTIVPIPRSLPDAHCTSSSLEEFATPDQTAMGIGDELRRGFEALSLSMKRRSRSVEEAHPAEIKVAGERRNKSEVEADVRRSKVEAEEVVSPVGISSNRGIVVQLC